MNVGDIIRPKMTYGYDSITGIILEIDDNVTEDMSEFAKHLVKRTGKTLKVYWSNGATSLNVPAGSIEIIV